MPGLTPARVACFGFAVADRVYRIGALPTGEGKHTAVDYAETGGGIAGTACVAIAALGGQAVFCGALGDDAAGRFVREELAQLGVDLAGLQVQPGRRTPSACVIVDDAGERCLVVDRGTAAAGAPDAAALAGVGAVLVDHRFPLAAAALLAALPPGVPSVLDAEGGDPAELRRLAALVRYPVFSRSGLERAAAQADPEAALRSLDLPRAAARAVTLGQAGSLWLVGDAVHHIPAPSVAVRDTTGCGDVFHGAFALAIAEGQAPLDAARFASAAAALKAQEGRGWLGMPNRAAVEDCLAGRQGAGRTGDR